MLRTIGTQKRGCNGSLFFLVCESAVDFLCCCGNLMADNKCARTKNDRCSKESGAPMLPLGTEISMAFEDGSADVSPFV
jgi:hypothetical protein